MPQPIPFEVTLPDVYAHGLQIAGGRGDEMAVYEALGQLSLNWNRVRPQLRNSDAGQRAVATRFDGLSNAVSKSADAKAKALLAPSLLGQVDELEHVFARRTEIKISAHNAPE